jgi:hypothetical protein
VGVVIALELMDFVEAVEEDCARDVKMLDAVVFDSEAVAGVDEPAVGEEEWELEVRWNTITM